MCARLCCEFDCFCAEAQASAVVWLSLAGTGLKDDDAVALEEQLRQFCALQHLDLSGNRELMILSVPMLRVVARLETFKCHGCSLLLPPDSLFSSPEANPVRIRELLEGGSSETELNLSEAGLTPAVAMEVAAVLQLYPALKHLDLSSNNLGGGAAAAVLSSLAGM